MWSDKDEAIAEGEFCRILVGFSQEMTPLYGPKGGGGLSARGFLCSVDTAFPPTASR